MLAYNFSQAGVEQVRRGVIAHGGLANGRVYHRIYFLAHANGLPGGHLMCAHALYWVVAAVYFGDDVCLIYESGIRNAHLLGSAGLQVMPGRQLPSPVPKLRTRILLKHRLD